MSQPTLSIISPVLDGERYLRGFIQSVIDQRCPEVEHIIVDGCSQDNSVNIIKEFAEKYPHIRLIVEKDSSPSDAINKGIAAAQGAFITILCLDDFYAPGTLNEVVRLLPALPQPAFLVGNCNLLNEKDELIEINKPEALTPIGILLKKPFPYNPSAYFYNKDLHEKVGLYRYHTQSDVDFLLRVFKVAKIHYVDKSWGNFRMLSDSITVKLKQAGQLESGKQSMIEEHLRTYPVLQRLFIRLLLLLNKRPRIIYYLGRAGHYFRDPKDIIRFVRKMRP